MSDCGFNNRLHCVSFNIHRFTMRRLKGYSDLSFIGVCVFVYHNMSNIPLLFISIT